MNSRPILFDLALLILPILIMGVVGSLIMQKLPGRWDDSRVILSLTVLNIAAACIYTAILAYSL